MKKILFSCLLALSQQFVFATNYAEHVKTFEKHLLCNSVGSCFFSLTLGELTPVQDTLETLSNQIISLNWDYQDETDSVKKEDFRAKINATKQIFLNFVSVASLGLTLTEVADIPLATETDEERIRLAMLFATYLPQKGVGQHKVLVKGHPELILFF